MSDGSSSIDRCINEFSSGEKKGQRCEDQKESGSDKCKRCNLSKRAWEKLREMGVDNLEDDGLDILTRCQ